MSGKTVEKLIERGITISLMESCTGGLLASMLTDTEGVSAVFGGSIVAYSNEAKTAAGVPKEIIDRYGVYSGETAEAMAKAAERSYVTDVAIGVTGTMGNTDPANPEGVCGEVYYCIVQGGYPHAGRITFDAKAMSRAKAKMYVAEEIFRELDGIIDEAE